MDSEVHHRRTTTFRFPFELEKNAADNQLPVVKHSQGALVLSSGKNGPETSCHESSSFSNEESSSISSMNGFLKELFLKHLSHFWPHLLLCLVLVLCDTALNVCFSFAFGQLVSLGQPLANQENSTCHNTQISNCSTLSYNLNDTVPLLQWVGVMFGALVIHFIVSILSSFLQVSVAVQVSIKLRKLLSRRIHRVSPSFFNVHAKRDIFARFVQDVNTVESLIASPLQSVVFSLILVATFIVYTMVMSWPIGIGVVVLFTIGFLLVYILLVCFTDHSSHKDRATNQLCCVLTEEIDGYLVNRVYNLSSYWSSRMKSILNRHYRSKAKCALFTTQFHVLSWITAAAFVCTIITFSTVLLVQLDWLSFHIGVSLLAFYFIVIMNLLSTSVTFPLFKTSEMALRRINALLHDQKHISVTVDQKDAENECQCVAAHPLELQGVCFSYDSSPTHWSVFNVSLKFRDGERVAIVGASGSGKSTLLKLVLQMYKPLLGEVVVGKNVKLAAMFQNNHVFNMSIRENIRLGNLKASDKDVEEAAKMADFHVWVSSLPHGYDTVISNSSEVLGGGERQRLALTRMLLSEAQIYVLDKVTNDLDPSTGAMLFDKVMEVTAGKTLIAVTNQLEQARHFECIVVLSNGRVKEQGSHDELLEMRGTYWHLLTQQEEYAMNPTYVVQHCGVTPSTNDLTIIPMTVTPGCFYNSDEGKTRVITTPMTFSPLHTLVEVHNSVTDDDNDSYTIQQIPSSSSGAGYITAEDNSPVRTHLKQHASTLSIDGPPIPLTSSTPSLKPQFQNQIPEFQNETMVSEFQNVTKFQSETMVPKFQNDTMVPKFQNETMVPKFQSETMVPEFQNETVLVHVVDANWYEDQEKEDDTCTKARTRLTLCDTTGVATTWWCEEQDSLADIERGCGQDTHDETVYKHEM